MINRPGPPPDRLGLLTGGRGDNACWGMSIHGQEAVYGQGNDVIVRLADTDYHEVARGKHPVTVVVGSGVRSCG